MSAAYAVPAYLGLSTLLCLSYLCVEFTKNKGKFDTTAKILLGVWCFVILFVASVVGGVSGEIMIGVTNITHLLIALILVCLTLIISSGIIWWS